MISKDRQKIINEARTYLGTPFHHQGRLKGIGIDCIGLIVNVGKSLNLMSHDNTCYSRRPDGVTLMAELRKCLIEKDINDIQPGDIVVYWIVNPDKPVHVGIITDYGFIHTYADVGRVVEHRLTRAWQKRIYAVFSYSKVK